MRAAIAVLAATAMLAGCAAGVPHGHGGAYAGQQSREIKALSEEDVKGYLQGAGMGFAKAAELNRHPGPMHTLEHAQALQVTESQRTALEALMKRHKDEARVLGAEVLRLERELDRMFADGGATEAAVDTCLAEIALAQARVRGSHLKAHLATTRLLTPSQVERYVELRGYAPARDSR